MSINTYGPLPQFGGGGGIPGSGTVTSVAVDNINGLSGTVLNPTTTPLIRLRSTGVSAYLTTVSYVIGNIIRGDSINGDNGVLYTANTNTSGAFVLANWTAIVSSGTVTSVSGLPVNGFTVNVVDPTSTPDISVGTSITGILYGNGTSVAAAIAANFPTLNQSTTGNAATATALQTSRQIYGNSFNGTADVTGIVNVNFGGIGVNTLTTYALLAGGTTSTGPVQQIAPGTVGQVLTYINGSTLPTWQNPTAVAGGIDPYDPTHTYNKGDYISGDGTNGLLGAIFVCNTNGTTGAFSQAFWLAETALDLSALPNINSFSGTATLPVAITGDQNSFGGYNSGNTPSLSGSYNAGYGTFCFYGSVGISGQKNSAFGSFAFGSGSLTSGSYNVGNGYGTGYGISTGSYNVLLGYQAGQLIDIGSANILIGGDDGTSGAYNNNLVVANPQNNNQIISIANTNSPIAAKMVLASPAGSAGPLSPRAITSADILSYSQAFNATTDWGTPSGGLYTISIPSVTHGQGVNVVNVQIFETSGANLILTTVNQVIINSTNGDVSFNVPQVPDARFAGKIFIIGAA